ncbi:uncharacterized protein TrAFT101_004783 [Trichoderma asperellum]|uniref:uncharacterized protein n=1 Tax=Trichoderma asperellum TaxID=101201 RepID=UPI00332C1D57|nr:hypothetical protein TrAFT101_004783 [Trichoderma asperellum]
MRLINTETLKLEEFSDDKPPSYAILSHTWGPDFEELTFSDVKNGITDKPGIGSIKFRECCKQAKANSINYAWIDTCCIDKANLVELGEAINSMFRWYSLATVCYAYLSDVPDGDDPSDQASKFRTSRWFKRGWTLQELLAPKHLRFYNSNWHCIGTKGSRSTVIQEITQIPRQFILGVAELHTASVAQRMSWAAQRETKRAEDLAYCLLGIFGITMPMIYGEGGKEAFFRLQEQIMKTTRDDSILAWGLLKDSSISNFQKSVGGDMFIHGDILAATPSDFENSGHIVTREQATNPLHSLDIFGGSLRVYLPLLTIDNTSETFGLLSCGPKLDTRQVTAIPLAKITSAAANEYVRPKGASAILHPKPSSDVLPELIHIKKDGQKNISTKNQQYLFYDEDVFAKIGLVIIDVVPRACWDDQLTLISQTNILNNNDPGQILIRFRQNKEQSLDFVIVIDFHQPNSRTDQLCCVFTCHRKTALDEIAGKFDRKTLLALRQANASNEHVHLRIELEPMEGNITSITPKAMASPSSYTINATMALENLDTVLESTRLLWERKKNDTDIKELSQRAENIKSRLGYIEEERGAIEGEVKQLKAKKRLLVKEQQKKIQEMQRLEEKQGHMRKRQNEIAERVVYKKKRLNEYYHTKGCEDGWTQLHSAMEIDDMDIMNLLFDGTTDIIAADKRWARWITASRKGNVDEIRSLLDTDETELEHKDGIFGRTPLAWASMNGHRDVVKLLLDTEKVDIHSEDKYGGTPLRWALERGYYNIVQLMLPRDKPDFLRKLRGHIDFVCSVAFSHDSKLLASGSEDFTAKLWDSTTGECLNTLQGHNHNIEYVAFSHDSKLVASASYDKTIKLWDSTTGKCLHTCQGHSGGIQSVTFSHDSKLVASASLDSTIKLWNSTTGECLNTFQGHNGFVYSVAFSHDSKLVASGSGDSTIKLWDSTTGECLHTFHGHSSIVCSAAFSHDSKLVASASCDKTIKLWDSTTGECLHTFLGHSDFVCSVAFSHDSKLIASRSEDGIAKLWASTTGECLYTLEGGYVGHCSAPFSHDSKLLVGVGGKDILIWDISIVHDLVTSSWYQDYSAARAKEIPQEKSEK